MSAGQPLRDHAVNLKVKLVAAMQHDVAFERQALSRPAQST